MQKTKGMSLLKQGLYFFHRYEVQLGYGFLLLIFVWGGVFGLLRHDYTQAVEEIERTNDQLTRSFEEHVRRSIHAVDEQLQLLKTEYERDGVTPAITAFFQRAIQNPMLLQASLIDASGNHITSLRPSSPGLNFADRSFFKAQVAADTSQLFISEPLVGRISKLSSVFISRRLNAPDGSFYGVAVVAVDPNYFSRFYQDMGLNPGQFVRVVGLDGIVRASWNLTAAEIGQQMKQSDLFEKQLPVSPTGHFYTSGRRFGVPRYVSYRSMTDYPLIVQVGYDAEPALAEYRERRELYLVAATAASGIILLFIGLAVANARRQRRDDERWRLVVEGVNDGIWDWDARTNRLFYADRCKEILGHQPEEIGDSREEWVSRCHPEDLHRVLQAIEEHKQGRTPFYNETQRLRCKDGSYKWVRSRGKVIRDESDQIVRMIGAMADIHVEKMATEALRAATQEVRESREKYKTLIDQAFEAVILIDPESRHIVECNSRFTEWFGYSLPEDEPLSIYKLLIDDIEKQNDNFRILSDYGYLPVMRRSFRHKNGSIVFMERAGTLINLKGRQLAMVTYRNISDQLAREQALRHDIAIARRIQQALLSRPIISEYVTVDTVFRSRGGDISGDLYHLEWRNDGQVLRGYLLDAPGHGLTTALYTATLSVLLHEAAELDIPLPEQLCWLNRQISQHFDDTAVIAAFGFELDLQVRELRYVGAGITRVLVHTANQSGVVMVPGLYLGVDRDHKYNYQTLPLTVGDLMYFTTDGLSELFDLQSDLPLERFSEMVSLLSSLPDLPACRDDATAVCIRINSLPQSIEDSTWPKVMKLSGYGDYLRMKGKVAQVLANVTGQAHSLQEVAVNEAIANALECRDGVARIQNARVKINRVGHRLIVRVKTSRIGFAGNALLRRLRLHPEEMFSFGEDASMGRGIPMMLSIADKMTYNSEGTEVLLAWKLPQHGHPADRPQSRLEEAQA